MSMYFVIAAVAVLLLVLWLVSGPVRTAWRRQRLRSQPFPAEWREILRRRAPELEFWQDAYNNALRAAIDSQWRSGNYERGPLLLPSVGVPGTFAIVVSIWRDGSGAPEPPYA